VFTKIRSAVLIRNVVFHMCMVYIYIYIYIYNLVLVCVSSLKVWGLYVDHRYSVSFKITVLFLKTLN
jgi:hypothetical protein